MFDEYSPAVMEWGAVIGASLIAAFTDVRTRRIPNVLTFPLLLTGLCYAAYVGGWSMVTHALLAAVVISLPFVILFVFAGGGAGDAKLMAAIGAWLGLSTGVLTLASICITGAMLAVLHTLVSGTFMATMVRVAAFPKGLAVLLFSGTSLRDLHSYSVVPAPVQTIPYGVSILVGTIIATGISLQWITL